MKAVIVETKKGHAVALREDGTFIQVPNKSYREGEVIFMNKKKPRMGWKGALVSAAAVFLLFFGVGVKAYNTPVYTVSMDVNPGVVMEMNMFERVIGCEGENSDGEAVLTQLNLQNMKAEDAVCAVVGQIEEMGYFGENGMIYMATVSKNEQKAEKLAKKLGEAVEGEVEENGIQAEVTSTCLGVEMVERARDLDITPGKLNVLTNVLGLQINESNIEMYKNMSIKQLMEENKVKGNSENAPGQDEDKETGKPEETPGNGEGVEDGDQLQLQEQEQSQQQSEEQEQNATGGGAQNQEENTNGEPSATQSGVTGSDM